MLGIGIGEMILIAGIALVIFGPEKFPDFAKIILRTMRDLRGYVDEIQSEISKEIKPVKRELEQLSRYDPEKYIDALTKSSPAPTASPVSTPDSSPCSSHPNDAEASVCNDDSFDDALVEASTSGTTPSPVAQEQELGTSMDGSDAVVFSQEGRFEAPETAPEKLD